jgi:GrpB-like predicted nucleotidyltransferase (UPF0157 family)
MTDRIEIVEYSEGWADRFAEVADGILSVMGGIDISVSHIGSTSVPGLAAKDIIDVQVSVDVLDPSMLRPRMESIGFTWRTDITSDHEPPGSDLPSDDLAKLYAQQTLGVRVNAHIRRRGAFNHRYALLFRDFLRADPTAADAYSAVKRQLAARFPADVDAYYDIKDPVMDIIMCGADQWALRTSWSERTDRPPPHS